MAKKIKKFKKHLVEEVSPPDTLEEFVKVIERDAVSKMFRVNVKRLITPLNLDLITKEVKDLHESRLVRYLSPKQVMTKDKTALLAATFQNQSFRSRATAIKMSIVSTESDLNQLVDDYYGYIIHRYNAELVEWGYKSVNDKTNFVGQFYAEASKWQYRVALTIKILDLFLEDVDEAKWSLQNSGKELQRLTDEKFDR